ncbi:hypothetical protein LUZ60_002819 [Juncus effusus]|nr:hypothetical protein LUZ60_002819 [Juncus effusus]
MVGARRGRENQETQFLQLLGAKALLYSIDIPELYGHFIVSSSYGWLFTIDERVNGYLLNPFTRECFELPPFPSFFDDMTMTFNADEAVIESNEKLFTMPFKELQTTIVSNSLLSHDPKENPDFTVIIMFGDVARPAIWRPRDTGWAIIDCPCPLSDVVWFEGKLYIYSFDVMFVVDVVGSSPKATEISTLMSGIMIPFWLYLVDFKGKLLLIERFCERNPTSRLWSQGLI